VKLVTVCVVPDVKIRYVRAVFVNVVNVLLPLIVRGLVVPPVEDNVPNVCPPPANVFAAAEDKLIVDEAPLNVSPVVFDNCQVLAPEPFNVIVLVPSVIDLVFELLELKLRADIL